MGGRIWESEEQVVACELDSILTIRPQFEDQNSNEQMAIEVESLA
jgi:hypothetical protein